MKVKMATFFLKGQMELKIYDLKLELVVSAHHRNFFHLFSSEESYIYLRFEFHFQFYLNFFLRYGKNHCTYVTSLIARFQIRNLARHVSVWRKPDFFGSLGIKLSSGTLNIFVYSRILLVKAFPARVQSSVKLNV